MWGYMGRGGGDTQPIRLEVGTLSQSDYRWGHSANQITGVYRGCAYRGCMRRGCVCRECTHRGCVRRGCARRGGGDTQPIRLQVRTGGACVGGVRAGGDNGKF